ncbi:hypothetical protein P8C59_001334 [Phyllachora maydis]|uniref:MOSC domain-containing protein n=1 Tax=Phyllachora maydis TaxID=1825666 RepID=A0AAD9HY74_9PEZI|nr:hypothetical protein P8C59_001334 [Phyllachora maydis]
MLQQLINHHLPGKMSEPAPAAPGLPDTVAALLRTSTAIDAGSVFVLLVTLLVFLLPIFLIFPPVAPCPTEAILQTHTRVGLDPRESKLKRAWAATKSEKPCSSDGTCSLPRLRSLCIYPVKSCAGIELSRARVLCHGLEYDRLFTFAQLRSPFPVAVDDDDDDDDDDHHDHWEVITQRQFPRLATVQAELYAPDPAKKASRTDEPFLVLRFPWRDAGLAAGAWAWATAKLARGRRAVPEREIMLPLVFPSAPDRAAKGYAFEPVRIWGATVRALNMEVELPPELRLYLGLSNRLALFRMDPAATREVHGCAPTEAEAGYQPSVCFQDAYPLHLLNLSSVRDLEEKVPKDETLQELDPVRFRPNIVVDGAPAYDEDSWKKIRCGPAEASSSCLDQATFHVSCRTTRCKLPNTDPDTGVRHPVEPDKTLRTHREVDAGARHKGCLGMQLTPLFASTQRPEDMETWLETGMSIEVLERGEHFFLK